MKVMRMVLMGWLTGGLLLVSGGGCAGDATRVGQAARPGRAVESPTEVNSASGEMARAAATEGIPLARVYLPNQRGEPATVRTIVDEVVRLRTGEEPLPPPPHESRPTRPAVRITVTTTQPATQPADK
ncbi:MAG: hypothetical protein FWD53_08100 [Phycisphaerales bacterium]|nr:hypothetical protein [Phycisphaerales bacterium]